MVSILDVFDKKDLDVKSDGNYNTICPDCGLQGGRTPGFILFVNNNGSFCQSSHKHFTLLETFALKLGIIKCIDGNDTGEHEPPLKGKVFIQTLDAIREEYSEELYNELIDQLGIRKELQIPSSNRLISSFSSDLGDIYKNKEVLFFRPESRTVVEIGKIKNQEDEYLDNTFIQLTPNRLITHIEKYVTPYTLKKTKDGIEKNIKSISTNTASVILESDAFINKLPIITRIFNVPIPIVYKEKLTLPKKGYDKRFRSWLPHNAPDIYEINFNEAVNILREEVFDEFPFDDNVDYVHAVAGLLTPFLRGLFTKFSVRTPVFIYMANRERAGKDYCAGISGIVYEGCAIEDPPISCNNVSTSSEELRKKLMSCFIQGRKRFHSSNNKGLIDNAMLENVTTSEKFSDRVLGRNDILNFNNEIDFSLSGNVGLKLSSDLLNRSRIINFALREENANGRSFKRPNLHHEIGKNRSKIISVLFSLVKHWFDNNAPYGTVPFTSFPEWAGVCGGIMECAGYSSPCNAFTNAFLMPVDAEVEEMKNLFEVCYEKYPDKFILKKDIVECVRGEEIMSNTDFDNKSDQTKFGIKMDKYVNRIFSNICLIVDNLSIRASRRRFKFTKTYINLPKRNIFAMNNGNTGKIGNFGVLTNIQQNKNINSIQGTASCHTYQCYHPVISMDNTVLKERRTERVRKKTDRELQFWEDPCCADIKIECTKERVYDYIKDNPQGDHLKICDDLGRGTYKFVAQLMREGKIKRRESDLYWDIVAEKK